MSNSFRWLVRLLLAVVVVTLAHAPLLRGVGNAVLLVADGLHTIQQDDAALAVLATGRAVGLRAPQLINQAAYLLATNEQTASARALLQSVGCPPCPPHAATIHNYAALTLPASRVISATQLAAWQQNALTLAPNQALAYYNQSIYLAQQGELTAAQQTIEEAIRLDYQWADPYRQKGQLQLQIGDFAGAEESARIAVALSPANSTARLLHIQALAMQRANLTLLLTLFDEALRVSPEDDIVLAYKSKILRLYGERSP